MAGNRHGTDTPGSSIDTATRQALAHAIAATGRGLSIDTDNRAGVWAAINTHIRNHTCYAVEVAQPILAVDFDNTDTADQAAWILAGAIDQLGNRSVIVASGQANRRHLFARIDNDTTRATLAAVALSLGGDVRRHIRPPGTPHRTGTAATLVTPDTWQQALEHLTGARVDTTETPDADQPVNTTAHPLPHQEPAPDRGTPTRQGHREPATGTNSAPQVPAPADAERPRQQPGKPAHSELEQNKRLDGKLAALIFQGDREHRWRRGDGSVDHSRMLLAICNIARNQGRTPHQIWRALMHPHAAAGASLRQRKPADARQQFTRTWEKAGTWKNQPISTRHDALAALSDIKAAADNAIFPGRTGNSDATVLDAAIELAGRWGGPVAPLPIRDLADLSGRSCPTVSKALKRLSAAGWLTRVAPANDTRAATWRLNIPSTPPRKPDTDTPPHGGRGSVQELRDRGHDGWAHGALGPGAWRCHQALQNGHHSARDIAQATGMHPGTARRHLKRLAEHRLAHNNGTGWEPADPAKSPERVEAAAVACGSDGRRHRNQSRHAAERARWETHIAEQTIRGRPSTHRKAHRGGPPDPSQHKAHTRPRDTAGPDTPGAPTARGQNRTNPPASVRTAHATNRQRTAAHTRPVSNPEPRDKRTGNEQPRPTRYSETRLERPAQHPRVQPQRTPRKPLPIET